ncbi:protein kinase domain-containing protein [Haematococcus lacustris]|uniref:Protein kinase domain-containing protein n=1 Tax=Haematococcus lacustris TaxID=44745 RepID=A0A699ZA66_HAELA|nr:protein kinase domain-containing protein [Haematococcus lacustris]
MASFWPWVAMYVAEVNAIRLVDLLEKIQTAPSLHSLAHVVTNELKCWFEWPLKEETEARLVLLSEDQVSALVLSQPVAVDRGASSLTRTKSQPVPITTGTTRAVTFAGLGTRADDVRLASRAAIPALRRIGEQSADLALSKSAPPSSNSACSHEQDEHAGTLLGQGMRAEAAAALHTDKDGYGGGHEKRQPTSSSPGLAEGAGGAASPVRRTASSLSARQSTEGRLLGTQMSLLNTLTRRCLVEGRLLWMRASDVHHMVRCIMAMMGSKLLFVADVMAALKKYGEPWKDIFLDQVRCVGRQQPATRRTGSAYTEHEPRGVGVALTCNVHDMVVRAQVANPVWVIAAPLASDGIHLGAIVWLSSSRSAVAAKHVFHEAHGSWLNPTMLASAAKTSLPPLLHSLADQLLLVTQQATQLRSHNSITAIDEVSWVARQVAERRVSGTQQSA